MLQNDSGRGAESAPLLSSSQPDDVHANNDTKDSSLQSSTRSFYLSLALIFLLQAGVSASVAPTTSILEDLICRRYYSDSHYASGQVDCKSEPVQTELAMLKGITSLFMLIPGILLVVPYGLLAGRWGILRIMMLSVLGIFLADAWYDVVCWYGKTWLLKLVWLSPAFYLVGGGSTVFVSLLFVFVANISPPELRASRFFQLEAAGFLGNIFSYLVSSALMETSPWVSILLGLFLEASAGGLLLVTVTTTPASAWQTTQQDATPAESSEPSPSKSIRQTMSTLYYFIADQKVVVALLFGYFLRMLGVSVTRLHLLYISKRFRWSYAHAAYLISFDSAVHLAVLLLLPIISTFLLRLSSTSRDKDIWLARLSNVFSFIGCAGFALSASSPLMVVSIFLYGFGAGYGSSIRGVLTSVTSTPHRALLYSVMSMLDVIGTLIGAPLWPAIYQQGLKAGGLWIGLPFGVAAILLATVSLTIETSRFTYEV